MGVAVNGRNHARIAWPIPLNTNEGLDGGLRDDFVVILAHPGLFARNVRALEHAFQKSGVVCTCGWNKGFLYGRSPFGFKFELRDAFVKEFDRKVGDRRFVVPDVEHAR